MCAVAAYYQLYRRHANLPGRHHAWFVRQARDLLNQHRATCPECKEDYLHTNYNLRATGPLTVFTTRATRSDKGKKRGGKHATI